MTGVGGGSLMTPLLILLFGIHPATAVGTGLLYAAATKSAGTVVHGLYQTIDWHVVGGLAAVFRRRRPPFSPCRASTFMAVPRKP
jgi:uncharacterized membrane protein YfcA